MLYSPNKASEGLWCLGWTSTPASTWLRQETSNKSKFPEKTQSCVAPGSWWLHGTRTFHLTSFLAQQEISQFPHSPEGEARGFALSFFATREIFCWISHPIWRPLHTVPEVCPPPFWAPQASQAGDLIGLPSQAHPALLQNLSSAGVGRNFRPFQAQLYKGFPSACN